MNNNYDIYRIILIGDSFIGKTTTLYKYLNNNKSVLNTIGVEYNSKILYDKNIKLMFFDMSGDKKYLSIRNIYYKKADIILIFINKESIKSVEYWLNEIIDYIKCKMIIGLVYINEDNNIELSNECKKISLYLDLKYWEISSNIDIDILFNDLLLILNYNKKDIIKENKYCILL